MPKAIACIPHKHRMEAHRVDYLRAISDAMDHPFQSEDGREPSPQHQKLTEVCKKHIPLNHWHFTNCCTDSLQIAFHALCKPGDLVIVPGYGWRAIKNAPLFMNLRVECCDIDETGNVDLEQLKTLIKTRQPTAVLIVHNFGTLVDVSQIRDYCDQYGVKIIEDAAPSFTLGEPYSYSLGSASDIVCFSFDFTKSPGCLGAGGAIATNDDKLAAEIKTICSHTSTYKNYGTKSYLDTVSAAVLTKDIELIKQNDYRRRRLEIATYYINNLPYKTLSGENYIFHRFIILTDRYDKQDVIKAFNSQKILAKSVFEPNSDNCLAATRFYREAIELPCHQFIDIDDLASRIRKIT